MRCRSTNRIDRLVGLALLVWAPVAAAQTFTDSPFDRTLQPGPAPASPSAPRLTFRLLVEIPLPGPLPGPGPRLARGQIEIPVAGGLARTTWDAQPEMHVDRSATGGSAASPTDPEHTEFAVAPDGRYRAAAYRSGWIVAQKRCRRCASGWRNAWRLRVPGTEFAPPLVSERRVYFGATDNRVYAVKRRNGHRLWETDVAGRVSRPLERWTVPQQPEAETPEQLPAGLTLLLVVPDSGSTVLALDALTGDRVARFELPENETVVGGALSTPDGKVAVALQKYDTREASLMVFSLAPAEAPAASEEPPPEAVADRASR